MTEMGRKRDVEVVGHLILVCQTFFSSVRPAAPLFLPPSTHTQIFFRLVFFFKIFSSFPWLSKRCPPSLNHRDMLGGGGCEVKMWDGH